MIGIYRSANLIIWIMIQYESRGNALDCCRWIGCFFFQNLSYMISYFIEFMTGVFGSRIYEG